MNKQQIERAASILVQARRDMKPLAGLPDGLKPSSVEEAHAIQDEVSLPLRGRLTPSRIASQHNRPPFTPDLPHGKSDANGGRILRLHEHSQGYSVQVMGLLKRLRNWKLSAVLIWPLPSKSK